MAVIEIENVDPINKNNLLCTCSVRIVPWKMTLHEVMIFQKGEQRWLGMPSRRWDAPGGEVKYTAHVTFDDDATLKRFRAQVMEAVDAYLAANPDMKPVPVVLEDDELPF